MTEKLPQDSYEEVLLSLYYEIDWVPINKSLLWIRNNLEPYVESIQVVDPLGKKGTSYRLNEKGKIVAEFIIKKNHREGKKKVSGLVIEKKEWLSPVTHGYSSMQVYRGIKYICNRGDVPVRKQKERDRLRIMCHDLERGFSRISAEIEWEKNRSGGIDYLISIQKFNPVAAWVWVEVLDKAIKELRGQLQTEFIVWDNG